jgi:hypothetical protein
VARNTDINFTGRSLGTILRPLAKQGNWYIDPELAAIIARALCSISVSEAPRFVVTWHGHFSCLYVQHRRTAVRMCTLGTQNSSTAALIAPSFPCFCDADSSAALWRSQSFPRACAGLGWRRFVLLGLARRGSTPRMGNIILDGQVFHANSRGLRHLASALRTLRLLVEEPCFVPDRVITNVVVKAALVSPTVLDGTLVRQLFDYFA